MNSVPPVARVKFHIRHLSVFLLVVLVLLPMLANALFGSR
jgi:nitrate reductase NapE component